MENKINDMNSILIEITNNLNDLINKEKLKEKEKKKEKEQERELILKECESMIKITLIDILEKKLNLDEDKKIENKKITRIKNKIKQNNNNKIPDSKILDNKYDDNFYRSYYSNNNNQKEKLQLIFSENKKNDNLTPNKYLQRIKNLNQGNKTTNFNNYNHIIIH